MLLLKSKIYPPLISFLSCNDRVLAVFAGLLLFTFNLTAQDSLPKNYFINPLDIPISLAGTFGEIRTDHYHTGIDIRTDGKEGLPVHAVAKGYVSRIVVSPYGYGNALYITHPNGYISLYGHLSRFNSAITAYVKNKQYSEEKYTQDISLSPGQFNLNQGDTIAFSGSTGAAEGPHLHFEIRNAKNDDPINPFLSGYTYVDNVPPIIKSIAIYPLNDSSSVNDKHEPLYIKTEKVNNRYQITSDTNIYARGTIGVGISCYDMADKIENHNGPYSKMLIDNSDTIYYARMDVLNFATIHFVNGHIDYAAMHKHIDTFEYSFLQENDKLKIYKKLINKGRINCVEGKNNTMEYCVSDFNGNTSTLTFTIQGDEKKPKPYHDTAKYVAIASYDKPFDYASNGMKIQIPAGALFNTLHFRYSVETDGSNTDISPIYNIQDENTPLSASYTLMLKPKPDLPDSLMKKAVVVRLEGKSKSSIGGHWDNGYMTVHPKTFGRYVLMIDLYRPVIKPLNIFKGKDMSQDTEIAFEVSDNLSGVSYYKGTVDGKWILVESNPKKSELYYTFDEHVGKGKHHLRLVVSDAVGNTTTYETDFTR
ncbi:MAG TPA: M23 family metallopeptidase [Bacteroidia bacterium]|nr:M23 family metallopeptidase [Bacteroidia bacterium]